MNYKTDVKEQFKKRFAELRAETGLSQLKLGKLLNLSPATIGYYENGDRVPDIVTAARIADYFSVSVDYLLGLSDIKSTEQDIKIACEITGLSEKAMLGLKSKIEYGDPKLTKTIDFVLEELEDDFNKESCGIMQALMSYLNTNCNDNRCLSISKSGKIIDLTCTSKEEINCRITNYEDIISVCEVQAYEIIDQVLFERLCNAIRKAKIAFSKEDTQNAQHNPKEE